MQLFSVAHLRVSKQLVNSNLFSTGRKILNSSTLYSLPICEITLVDSRRNAKHTAGKCISTSQLFSVKHFPNICSTYFARQTGTITDYCITQLPEAYHGIMGEEIRVPETPRTSQHYGMEEFRAADEPQL